MKANARLTAGVAESNDQRLVRHEEKVFAATREDSPPVFFPAGRPAGPAALTSCYNSLYGRAAPERGEKSEGWPGEIQRRPWCRTPSHRNCWPRCRANGRHWALHSLRGRVPQLSGRFFRTCRRPHLRDGPFCRTAGSCDSPRNWRGLQDLEALSYASSLWRALATETCPVKMNLHHHFAAETPQGGGIGGKEGGMASNTKTTHEWKNLPFSRPTPPIVESAHRRVYH